jgi:hypothetical protein
MSISSELCSQRFSSFTCIQNSRSVSAASFDLTILISVRSAAFPANEYNEVLSGYHPSQVVERRKNQRFEHHLCYRSQGADMDMGGTSVRFPAGAGSLSNHCLYWLIADNRRVQKLDDLKWHDIHYKVHENRLPVKYYQGANGWTESDTQPHEHDNTTNHYLMLSTELHRLQHFASCKSQTNL